MIAFSISILKSKSPLIGEKQNNNPKDDDDDGGLGIDLRDFPDFDLPPGVYLESDADKKSEEELEDLMVS